MDNYTREGNQKRSTHKTKDVQMETMNAAVNAHEQSVRNRPDPIPYDMSQEMHENPYS
jgi:hypothetical protein